MRRDLSFKPLTPTNVLRRSALVFAERTAAVDGEATFTYAQLWQRVQLLAGVLRGVGVSWRIHLRSGTELEDNASWMNPAGSAKSLCDLGLIVRRKEQGAGPVAGDALKGAGSR